MKSSIVLIGAGEMGGVFARGFLRTGHPVIPVTREQDMRDVAAEVPTPALALVAVAEADLHTVLADLPETWQARAGLLQNELLPRDWQRHGLQAPTVISVWFEKKPGREAKVIIPSPVYGSGSVLIQTALESIGIPVRVLGDEHQLLHELVLKNVYILTTNICGLRTGGSVGELWQHHQALARAVAEEVIALQAWLTGERLDPGELIRGMQAAFDGDPEHLCMGRSAPARLQRALALADEAGLEVPTLREIAAEHGALTA